MSVIISFYDLHCSVKNVNELDYFREFDLIFVDIFPADNPDF